MTPQLIDKPHESLSCRFDGKSGASRAMFAGRAGQYMERQTRLILYYAVVLVGTLVGFTLAYAYGMRVYESEPRSLLQSLQIVLQTFTTVGYGDDAPWRSSMMTLLVIGMQVSTALLVFAALPVFVVPLIENALEITPPKTTDASDHVIICTYTPRGEELIGVLEWSDTDYLIVEPDREVATDLYEENYPVVHGNPESIEALENAGIQRARAVVADANDEINASIVLAAREAADATVLSIVSDSTLAPYHRYAGADRVLSPHQLLGERLTDTAISAVAIDLDEVLSMEESFRIVELPVHSDSELAGQTLEGSEIAERTGARVIGVWLAGKFVGSPGPEATLGEHASLLAIGRDAQLQRLEELTQTRARQRRQELVVVAGLGEVGSAAADALEETDVPWMGLDIADGPSVDLVGDATDPETFRSIDIDAASTVLLALPDDTQTGFAALVIRELNPEAEIIARANDTRNVRKLYRAGADYVLALATVSGQMIASELIRGESLPTETPVEVARTSNPDLAGRSLAKTNVRSKTGITVIAVERSDDVLTGITPSFVPERDDTFIAVGTAEDLQRFESLSV